VSLHFGRVDRTVGAVTGWQAQATETGDLIVYRVAGDASRTEAFRLTADGIKFAAGEDMEFGTTVGTRMGLTTSDKLSFHGATATAQDTGWSVTGTSTRRSVDSTDTLANVIDTLGTLVQKLTEKGLIGP
jgi:hypothetical protein